MRKATRFALVAAALLAALLLIAVSDARADCALGSEDPSVNCTEREESTAPAALQPRPGARSGYFGVRGGYYSAAGEPFLGFEYLAPIGERWSINPNAEWIFFDEATFLTVNADLQYDFPLQGPAFYWVGAGLGLKHFAKGGGWPPENRLGVNLLGGVGLSQGTGMMPYIQGKIRAGGGGEFVLSAGLRF